MGQAVRGRRKAALRLRPGQGNRQDQADEGPSGSGRGGGLRDSRNLTVGEYAPLWLDSIKQTVGPRTWKRHEELTRLHVIPRLGSAKLDKLNALQVQALYRKKLDSGLSPPPSGRFTERSTRRSSRPCDGN